MSDQIGNEFLDNKGFYKDLTIDESEQIVNKLLGLWEDFLKAQNEGNLVKDKDYFIHQRNLYEVIKRLDKRKTYYYVFHKIDKICEYKELGILCYWINTLKPFMVVNSNAKIYNAPNEMFSVFLIVAGLAKIFKHYNPGALFIPPDAKTIQDYVYNFKYCDLNREAMIFFVETLAKSYGIGMETNSAKDKYCAK